MEQCLFSLETYGYGDEVTDNCKVIKQEPEGILKHAKLIKCMDEMWNAKYLVT